MSMRFRCERIVGTTTHIKGFINAYKEAFGGAPYFEWYTDDQVLKEIWQPHIAHGVVMIVTDEEQGGRLVGFGCAMPFEYAPDDVKQFLTSLDAEGKLPPEFDHRSSWYMSELGVLNEYRGLGAAWELVKQRMRSVDHSGATQFFMRTAAKGSLSKPMYIKMGSKELADLQDVSKTKQATENKSKADHRVYLWGDVRTVAQHIDEIQKVRGYIPFDTSGIDID